MVVMLWFPKLCLKPLSSSDEGFVSGRFFFSQNLYEIHMILKTMFEYNLHCGWCQLALKNKKLNKHEKII